MGKGLPIETQKPVIEMVARADMACSIGHADFAYYPKTVQHTDKTVVKGDTYMGEETVANINKLIAKSEVKSGWYYKITGASGGLVNNSSTGSTVYVNEGDVVAYLNGVWNLLSRNRDIYVQAFTSPDYSALKSNYTNGNVCCILKNEEIFQCYENNNVFYFSAIVFEKDANNNELVSKYLYSIIPNASVWNETIKSRKYLVPTPPSDDAVLTSDANGKLAWDTSRILVPEPPISSQIAVLEKDYNNNLTWRTDMILVPRPSAPSSGTRTLKCDAYGNLFWQ